MPILSCLKLQVLPIPTATLTNQTAYSSFYIENTGKLIKRCQGEWGKIGIRVDGLITGFFTSPQQINDTIELYKTIKREDSILIVDPIMGDDGEKYTSFDSNLCEAIMELAKQADIITPNLTEACLLADIDYNELIRDNDSSNYLDIVISQLSVLANNKKAVVITGIRQKNLVNDKIYNILFTQDGTAIVGNSAIGATFSGAGDVFAAVFAGLILRGKTYADAFNFASDFVYQSIINTRKSLDAKEGLDFELILNKLTEL